MQCPVCNNSLTHLHLGSIDAEVCSDGCGGLWFDAGELAKVDEGSEAVREDLLRIRRNASVVVDRTAVRRCPHCQNTPLTQRFYDQKSLLEIDECPKCHGHWLDLGELEAIRTLNDSSEKRKATYEQFEKENKNNPRAQAVLRLLFK